jgi:hypothetical protein
MGRLLTPSKILPTYKPIIPKIMIISPDKNQMEIIILA